MLLLIVAFLLKQILTIIDTIRQNNKNKCDSIISGGIDMKLNSNQLNSFINTFEIKANSVILVEKGNIVTIIINSVIIFDVPKELVSEFF